MSNRSAAKALHDKRTDLRAFIIARHPEHGILLLRANKKKKGVHFQLPGGHVDEDELANLGAGRASKAAAARELFEETGIDVRGHLARLEKLPVNIAKANRTFFVMDLTPKDAVGKTTALAQVSGSGGSGESKHNTSRPKFTLKLSHEHTGFIFEPDLNTAAEMTIMHSGGACSQALRMMADILQQMSPRAKSPGRNHKKTLSDELTTSRGRDDEDDELSKHSDLLGAEAITIGNVRLTVAEQDALASLEEEERAIARNHKRDSVSSDCCGWNCFKNSTQGAVKVDPKTYFANERTFLNWIHTSATLGSFGMLTYNLAKSQVIADGALAFVKGIGMTMIAGAMVMILHAVSSFYMRSQLVRRRAEGPYEMSWGPTISSVVLVGVFGSLIAIWANIYMGSGGGGGHPSPSPAGGGGHFSPAPSSGPH